MLRKGFVERIFTVHFQKVLLLMLSNKNSIDENLLTNGEDRRLYIAK